MGTRFQLECLMAQGAHCPSPIYPHLLSLRLSWEQVLLSWAWECPHLYLGKEGRLLGSPGAHGLGGWGGDVRSYWVIRSHGTLVQSLKNGREDI